MGCDWGGGLRENRGDIDQCQADDDPDVGLAQQRAKREPAYVVPEDCSEGAKDAGASGDVKSVEPIGKMV